MERFVQVVALIVIGALWALTFPLTKIAVSAEYRAFGLIFWSSLIALIALAPVLVVRGRGLPMSAAGLWRYAFLGLCGTVFPSAASYTAAQHLPSGVLALCMIAQQTEGLDRGLSKEEEEANAHPCMGGSH